MGTRSVTTIYDQFGGAAIAHMFVHWDGYLSGVGRNLKNCLKDIVIVNGINPGDGDKVINRMGRLASYIVKNSDLDIEFLCDTDDDYVDFRYHLTFNKGKVDLRVTSYGDEIYNGLISDFNPEELEKELNQE